MRHYSKAEVMIPMIETYYVVSCRMKEVLAKHLSPSPIVVKNDSLWYLGGFDAPNNYMPAWTDYHFAHHFDSREDARLGFAKSDGMPWMFNPKHETAMIIRVTEMTTKQEEPL